MGSPAFEMAPRRFTSTDGKQRANQCESRNRRPGSPLLERSCVNGEKMSLGRPDTISIQSL